MTELSKQIYKTPPLTDAFVVAHLWISRGWQLLPCQPGTKRLVMGFGPNRGVIGGGDDVRFWFQERGANLAVLASDSGVILDFDKIELYDLFAAGWPGLAGSYTESTPRGGRHVFLELAAGDGLALPGLVRGVEVKRFCLAHPSIVEGEKYEIIESGAILTIPPAQLKEALSPFFVVGDKYQPASASRLLGRPGVENGHFSGGSKNRGILAKVKAAWPILSYLTFFEPKLRLEGSGRWRSGRCPWHEDHNPSMWVNLVRNTWGCQACGAHGDIVNWHARRLGTTDQTLAARDLATYHVRVVL
jgi:hypothetical protein